MKQCLIKHKDKFALMLSLTAFMMLRFIKGMASRNRKRDLGNYKNAVRLGAFDFAASGTTQR
jgi:hypothetical protein